MNKINLANSYLTDDSHPPAPHSYRYRKWRDRGYQESLAPISSDSEGGTLIGQMGWAGSHAHTHGYLWGSAGNMGALMMEPIDQDCLIPIEESPRGKLPSAIVVKDLVGRQVLLTKSGSRLDMIALEHPALNLTILEVEPDGVHYRMRFGTPTISQLEHSKVAPPKPTSEFFHYMLIFDRLGDEDFNALVHLQPKFLNLISRSEHGNPDRFYNFLKGYEPETPIMYENVGGIGLVMEKAPGIPDLSFQSLQLFRGEDLTAEPLNQAGSTDQFRRVVYWLGHGTFSRGHDILDSYRHTEYFEAAARMAWEANQKSIDSQAYSEEIVSCILNEFSANQLPDPDPVDTSVHTPPLTDIPLSQPSDMSQPKLEEASSHPSASKSENLYNYP